MKPEILVLAPLYAPTLAALTPPARSARDLARNARHEVVVGQVFYRTAARCYRGRCGAERGWPRLGRDALKLFCAHDRNDVR